MSSAENYRAAARAMDAAFLQFFKENPNNDYGSGEIAKIFGESTVEGQKGQKNWKWFSHMEDLHSKGLLNRRIENCTNSPEKVKKKYFFIQGCNYYPLHRPYLVFA